MKPEPCSTPLPPPFAVTARLRAYVRIAARELLWFSVFLAVAAIFTWPLVVRLAVSVSDAGDPLLNAWILDWTCHALSHAPLRLFDAPIYHPGLFPLAYSEHLTGIALVVMPFHLSGLPPLTVYNIAMLLGFAFSAWGAFVLARLVTGSTVAAFGGALFFAFGSFAVMHVPHLQVVWSGWLPLLLAALLAFWRTPTAGRAGALGLAFAMNGLTNIYWLLYGGFAIVVTIVLLQIARPRTERLFWTRLVAALAVASAVLLPFLIPYQMVASHYGAARASFESRLGSASVVDWFMPSSNNWLYGDVPPPHLQRAERQLFPGIAILALCASAFFLRPRGDPAVRVARDFRRLDAAIAAFVLIAIASAIAGRVELGPIRFAGYDVPAVIAVVLLCIRLHRTWPDALRDSRFSAEELSAGLWIVIGFVASLGWNAFLHPFLFRVVTPFRATRTPARWAVLCAVGLAVWAAMGISAILARSPLARRRVLASFLLAAVALEVVPDVRWEQFRPHPPPVYRWLAAERPGVLLELPLDHDGSHFRAVFFNSAHRLPTINGTSGWETPLHETLRNAERESRFDDAFLAEIENAGTAVVLVHGDNLGGREGAVKAWLRRHLDSGRLSFLRRFDHELSGDYLFAVTRNLHDAARFRAREVPDAAGYLPAHNLERWLRGEETYGGGILLLAESPGGDVEGALTVRGFALSEHGIRSVTVLFEQGLYRVDATLEERPDVQSRFPWYAHVVPRPGYRLVLPARPRGVPERTDVQVEVVDGAGRRARTRDLLFQWR